MYIFLCKWFHLELCNCTYDFNTRNSKFIYYKSLIFFLISIHIFMKCVRCDMMCVHLRFAECGRQLGGITGFAVNISEKKQNISMRVAKALATVLVVTHANSEKIHVQKQIADPMTLHHTMVRLLQMILTWTDVLFI